MFFLLLQHTYGNGKQMGDLEPLFMLLMWKTSQTLTVFFINSMNRDKQSPLWFKCINVKSKDTVSYVFVFKLIHVAMASKHTAHTLTSSSNQYPR